MDSEFLCGMENFEEIWKRVRGEEIPPCPSPDSGMTESLHKYMEAKCVQAALYRELACCCGNPTTQGFLLQLQRVEQKHFRCLQLEHFLLTGRCYRPSEKCIKTDGFLFGLRQAWLREKEAVQNLRRMAVTLEGTLRESLFCIAKEDAHHAAELYALIKRCIVG